MTQYTSLLVLSLPEYLLVIDSSFRLNLSAIIFLDLSSLSKNATTICVPTRYEPTTSKNLFSFSE